MEVHAAAVRSLVMGVGDLSAETNPETLRFDLYRLIALKGDFRYLVTAAAMIVTAADALRQSKVVAAISDIFVPESRREIDREQVTYEIDRALESSTLDEKARVALRNKMLLCLSPLDAVHMLFAQRIRAFWEQLDWDGRMPSDLRTLNAACTLAQRINKAATELRRVITVDRWVHLTHYERIVNEEARKIEGGH